jgi:DNA-binding XRE family transcriptional regulator
LKLQKALEEAGIEFVEENGGGAGVRFFRARPLHEVGQQSATSDQLKASKTRGAVKILKVSIRQIKAARVLLDWPQDRLARAAGLSVPTIKRLEAQEGPLRGRSETGYKIAAALEKAGIEFIDENGGGPGVRLKKPLKSARDR